MDEQRADERDARVQAGAAVIAGLVAAARARQDTRKSA